MMKMKMKILESSRKIEKIAKKKNEIDDDEIQRFLNHENDYEDIDDLNAFETLYETNE